MTVCIAALYGNGQGVVLASDHMITAHIPIGYEFENDETSKIEPLKEDTYVLTAGNVLFSDQIVQSSRITVAGEGLWHVRDIAEAVKLKYQEFRLSYLAEHFLIPRGLSMESYYGRHNALNPVMVQIIDEALEKFDIGVELMVVGQTGEGFGIYAITNPGLADCLDVIGFGAIGSGSPHVVYSLLGSTYRKSLDRDQVESLVTKAKTLSEVAPGVGNQTTVHVLPEEGSQHDSRQSKADLQRQME